MLCIISSSILSPRSSKLDVEGLTESALCAGTIRQRLAGTASSAADMAGHALVSMVAFSSMLTLTQVCDARVVKNVSLADAEVAGPHAQKGRAVRDQKSRLARHGRLDWDRRFQGATIDRSATRRFFCPIPFAQRVSILSAEILRTSNLVAAPVMPRMYHAPIRGSQGNIQAMGRYVARAEDWIGLVQALGGRMRGLLPSDLGRVGAHARSSLPASGASYAPPPTNRFIELADPLQTPCGPPTDPLKTPYRPPANPYSANQYHLPKSPAGI
eukprot:1179665-Prorocentrum_minimum.AAC.4